jgi:replicative DNA helicase
MSEAVSRIPPMNLEAEQSLLGSMMLSEEAVVKAVEMIAADDFYQVSHRHIFQALLDLFEAQRPCDAVTLQEMLRSRNSLMEIGGATYLSQLLNSVPTAANAEHYAVIVREKSILRKLISVTGDISKQAYEAQAEVEELLDSAESRMMALSHFRITKPYVPMKSLVREVFAHLEYLYENKVGVTGIPSGFSALDQYTSGFQNSDLIIVAARPSMGKTAFTLNVAQNVASKGLPVLFFSLEMGCKQLVQRIMCSEARIDGQKLRSGFLGESDWPKLTMVAGELEQTPLFIDDTPNASLLEIRSKARRALSQEGIKLIMIDYLQLISHQVKGNGDRQQEISAISRGLKGLARELNVPVICLSQLSRAVESRTDKRPILADLRESGAIEQDADIVMFLYRDIYYNPKKEESRNKAEIIIAKQRNGPVGGCELAFFSEYARFDNLDNTHHYHD